MGIKEVSSITPILAIAVPFFYAVLIGLLGNKSIKLRSTLVVLSAISTFSVVALLIKPILAGNLTIRAHLNLLLTLNFKPHPLGMIIATLASFMWIPTAFYSIGYMAHEHAQTRFYTFLTFVLAATMGLTMAGDLFTFYVFYEIFSLCVYPLVIHEETPEAMQGGKVYLILSLFAGAIILMAVLATYGLTGGHGELLRGGILGHYHITRRLLIQTIILFAIGFSVKAAIMPLHIWLPQAMVAPTPVSAVLHAVAVVKVGVFTVTTLLYLIIGTQLARALGIHNVLPWFASFTIIVSSIIALMQDDIKRRLAYSTIGQLSYMVLGVSLLNKLALQGAIMHLLSHSFMKIVLFFCAGLIITQSGKRKFSQTVGQGREMPITWACFTIAAVAMIGIPPTCGFVSKWALVVGCYAANRYEFILVLLISCFLNLGYFGPPIIQAWFGKPEELPEVALAHAQTGHPHGPAAHAHTNPGPKGKELEAPLSMLIPTSILALLCIVLGIYFIPISWFGIRVAQAIF